MSSPRIDALRELAEEAELERRDFLYESTEQLRRFLEFWSSNIEGKLHSVKVGQARSADRGRFRHVSTSLRLH